MTEQEQAVWDAISAALHKVGGSAIEAGLASVDEDGRSIIATAAIEAMRPVKLHQAYRDDVILLAPGSEIWITMGAGGGGGNINKK